MIDYDKYDNIIFDFDGVVVDSNFIKEKCISKASKKYCNINYHERFVEYFTKHNGIPREIKLNEFFDSNESIKILEDYNICLSKKQKYVKLTNSLQIFIKLLEYYKKKLYILSGGTQTEVKEILKSKKLDKAFLKIMGGPKTKEENINNSNIDGKTLFIGDSIKDYEIANIYGYDFIFMYGYSQLKEWREFFKEKQILMSIRDFSVLTNCKC